MKKKILICIKNPFAIDNLFSEIASLSQKFDITILTTNHLLNDKNRKKYENFGLKYNIESFKFIPYFSKKPFSRSINSIIRTHVFLRKLKKKIDFKKFDLCISDSKFDIWQRIIFENFIDKNCIQVGLTLDAALIPLKNFKQLIDGEDVMKIVENLHKLRQDKNIKRKKPPYLNRLQNFINRQKDILLDRKIISKIFYNKKFNYKELDFNLMETDKFDYKLSLFYSSYYFWSKIYKQNSFLINLKKNCKCDANLITNKNKALFISTIWSEYKKDEHSIKEKIEKICLFFQLLKQKNSNLNQLDFRFHPEEDEHMKKRIKDLILKKNLTFFNFEESNLNLRDIACNYNNAFGALSGALGYLKKFCNNIEVHCLRSLSEEIFGKYYYLKLINENVIHYDDINMTHENYEQILNSTELNIKKYDLDKFIFSLLTKTKNDL